MMMVVIRMSEGVSYHKTIQRNADTHPSPKRTKTVRALDSADTGIGQIGHLL